MNILIINAHPDYQNALRGTNQLADFTLKQIQQHLPDAHIEKLALYAPETTIPEITAENLHDPSLIDAQQNELIAQFKRANLIMIFMPLHNFNIVSRLKDYIDNILIANKTFNLDYS